MASGRMKILPLILLSGFLLVSSFLLASLLTNVASMLIMSGLTSIVLLAQSLIAVAFPSTLFGRWRGSAYKEKIAWNSFKLFLSDLALMKKYAPQDLSMWGDWLAYGTALGVGTSVVKAMRELGVFTEELKLAPNIPSIVLPIMAASLPKSTSGGSVGGMGGGGFGGSGGFGGGGGGAR